MIHDDRDEKREECPLCGASDPSAWHYDFQVCRNCTRSEDMDLNNQKRIIASQVILELFDAKQKSQLELLQAQIVASIKALDKA